MSRPSLESSRSCVSSSIKLCEAHLLLLILIVKIWRVTSPKLVFCVYTYKLKLKNYATYKGISLKCRYDESDWRVTSQKPHKKHKDQQIHHHHGPWWWSRQPLQRHGFIAAAAPSSSARVPPPSPAAAAPDPAHLPAVITFPPPPPPIGPPFVTSTLTVFRHPPRSISMEPVVDGVTHDPINALRRLERARTAQRWP
jgi:hypothetical protein